MLRLRARNPTERVNSGLVQTFLKMYSENRDGVTAMLSYEQVNVCNGVIRDRGRTGSKSGHVRYAAESGIRPEL
jgi:hypothetical protein